MNPNCTALVRIPMSAGPMPHALRKSSAALFALNHSDVPNNCAIAIVATGATRGLTIAGNCEMASLIRSVIETTVEATVEERPRPSHSLAQFLAASTLAARINQPEVCFCLV